MLPPLARLPKAEMGWECRLSGLWQSGTPRQVAMPVLEAATGWLVTSPLSQSLPSIRCPGAWTIPHPPHLPTTTRSCQPWAVTATARELTGRHFHVHVGTRVNTYMCGCGPACEWPWPLHTHAAARTPASCPQPSRLCGSRGPRSSTSLGPDSLGALHSGAVLSPYACRLS